MYKHQVLFGHIDERLFLKSYFVLNLMKSIIAESGDVAETTGEKIATIIRHQQNVSVNFIETISESTLLIQEKRRSRQSLLSEFANEVETA